MWISHWLSDFFGLKLEHKKVIHQNIFTILYHSNGGFTHSDVYNLPIYLRDFYLNEIIEVKKKGQKSATEFQKNTSEELVEIKTGTIDEVYKIRTGKGSKGSKTKDVKMIANNFKAISKAFFINFDKAITLANKKDVKFFDLVDEEVWQNLSNSFTLFNSKAYQDMRNFSQDYEVHLDGKTVIKKDNNKKIA